MVQGAGRVFEGDAGMAIGIGDAAALDRASVTGGRELPSFTYRGESRGPQEIFNEGFTARGTSSDLYLHALNNTNPPSMYISTSKSCSVASDFNDNVYVVRPANGIDVNKILGSNSPYPNEQEIAIPNSIAPGDIRAVTIGNQSLLNPNWLP